jgi:hypothetical protein
VASVENVQLPKGTFESPGPCWIQLTTRDGKPFPPLIKCVCGTLYGTTGQHIQKDGTVTASWLSKECCQYHVYLKLLDWPGEDFPPSSGEYT